MDTRLELNYHGALGNDTLSFARRQPQEGAEDRSHVSLDFRLCSESYLLKPSLVLMIDSRRPLRTYSKRAPPSDTGEPPLKRRRAEEVVRDSRPVESPRPSPQQASHSQPSLPPPHAPRHSKGTILSYFKVVSPSSSSNLSSSVEPSSCGIEPTSTPPSSPPPKAESKPRKRRKLTTRAVSRDLNTDETEGTEDPSSPAPEDDRVNQTSREASRVLEGTSASTLNQTATQLPQQLEPGKRGKAKSRSPKSKSSVQTTLSLSMSDQGFTECKDCHMLYNPYHEKDAKLHARRHAAMLKTKSKKVSATPLE